MQTTLIVDDLITHTQGWTRHLGCLIKTFERISKAGLTVKPSKCQFGFSNLNFVGHTVGSGVLRPGESKVKAAQEASRPQTKRQVKSFLGLVVFFRKYIPIFASVAVPLTDLTKKGLPNQVNWGESQEHAFNDLKHSDKFTNPTYDSS